jgi:hypothetical protein
MKYHYQQGIIEKDKKGHKKGWLAFFIVIGVLAYGGFDFATLALNGFPVQAIDNTAKLIKNTKPGSLGNHLFIPAINLTAQVGASSLRQSGDPQNSSVTLKGSQLAFGLTPTSLRASSPFFNLSQIKTGDQIFLDSGGTRYVYRVVSMISGAQKKLTLETKNSKLIAEAIGTVALHDGSAQLQAL